MVDAEVTPVMIIDRMLEILATPEAWVKKMSACDKDFNSVCPDSRDACMFCLSGAFCRAVNEFEAWHIEEDTWGVLFYLTPGDYGAVSFFNDAESTTHADVLDFLRAVRVRLGGAV